MSSPITYLATPTENLNQVLTGKMRKAIPCILWATVLLALGYLLINSRAGRNPLAEENENQQDGRVFSTTSWNYFPQVKPFEMVAQTGDVFHSRELAGKPYAISFFFSYCPTHCAQLNRRLQTLSENFRKTDLMFVSVTLDPKHDSPEVLERYANSLEAKPHQWRFLTDDMHKIQDLGRSFEIVLDLSSHTDDILLVDKWGRYRDRFKWDDPLELARFEVVAKGLLAETEPPIGLSFETRNALAGVPHEQRKKSWLDEFFLVDHDDRICYSRDFTGNVWIANLFFTNCPLTCKTQTEYIKSLIDRVATPGVKYVSISTDPSTDTPSVLRQYRQNLGIEHAEWRFLTGESSYIRRICAEFFGTPLMGSAHHSTELFVVDRWGNVRGKFDWQKAGSEAEMLRLIDGLARESVPPTD
ncbi:MAG TPA: SCO family protein [Pirellulaceae bacterium]|nr:SCO family protein [Pirellulaceae bacterium]HMO91360.1 SCO family protein [Pirellulaceae bacterium]HMP70248.1 SCO family protein [Pirellulaceae bacterium]